MFNDKYGIEDNAAKVESSKIQECTDLLKRMDKIISKNENYKPALVQKIRNFKITIDPLKMNSMRDMETLSNSQIFKTRLNLMKNE